MRILADDELVSRKKLLNIMAAFGQCMAAETGTDALRLARSKHPWVHPGRWGLLGKDKSVLLEFGE